MKNLLFTISLLVVSLSFSQEKEAPAKTQPLFLSTINIDGSYFTHTNLEAISESIKTTSSTLVKLDKIDNRNLVSLTKDINKIYKYSDFNSKPNLNVALDNVMFSGNFFNPVETHYSALYKE
ncbi:hypothetical protein [Lacinutrix mariniflava]|uniref:hypothetical protein n=1 Tax=Lacinutrix mariniflava TaxID=342955 RepID=UPI0006E2DFC4|nr:hypothetical protein [Lacinutrix mariniflava]